MSSAPEFSVIVPFYNEEGCVGGLLGEVRKMFDPMGADYEVIAVDDGSADASRAEVVALAAGWPELRVVAFSRNRGQAAALLDGMRVAQGKLLVTMDADGQNDPADVVRLIEALRAGGADMVCGVRAERQDSWLRRKMSRVANAVRERILWDGVRDSGCALKVFRAEVVDAFIPIRTLYSFMPALAVAAGFKVQELTVHHRARETGVSKYGLGVMLWLPLVDMLGVWWFTRRRYARAKPEAGLE